jgi:phosphoglycolate phosphatase
VAHSLTLLFDLDGTLIDSTEAILESFAVAYRHCGGTLPEVVAITSEIGHPLDGMFASFGVEAARVEEYVAAYKAHYRQISRAKTVLLPNAADAVREASRIARLGVVTTKTGHYSVELLEHLGLMGHFEVVIGREDVTYPKPHPEPIIKALSKLDVDTKNCWMIGDTCMDMLAAREAGVKSIAVTSGYAKRPMLAQCSDFIVQDALSAVKLLGRL